MYLRGTSDIQLHRKIVMHLQDHPVKYIHLWEFYGGEGALFILLQCMLDAGEITADNLKDGLITDNSTIALAGWQPSETKPRPPARHLPSLHTPFA
jgi:hypothetical protein